MANGKFKFSQIVLSTLSRKKFATGLPAVANPTPGPSPKLQGGEFGRSLNDLDCESSLPLMRWGEI